MNNERSRANISDAHSVPQLSWLAGNSATTTPYASNSNIVSIQNNKKKTANLPVSPENSVGSEMIADNVKSLFLSPILNILVPEQIPDLSGKMNVRADRNIRESNPILSSSINLELDKIPLTRTPEYSEQVRMPEYLKHNRTYLPLNDAPNQLLQPGSTASFNANSFTRSTDDHLGNSKLSQYKAAASYLNSDDLNSKNYEYPEAQKYSHKVSLYRYKSNQMIHLTEFGHLAVDVQVPSKVLATVTHTEKYLTHLRCNFKITQIPQ
jgi:hypothetical protein